MQQIVIEDGEGEGEWKGKERGCSAMALTYSKATYFGRWEFVGEVMCAYGQCQVSHCPLFPLRIMDVYMVRFTSYSPG